MQQMPRITARLCLLVLLLATAGPTLTKTDEPIEISFSYSTNRGTILVHARINDKPVLLILDTGSAHTVVQPAVLGIKAHLEPTKFSGSGGGFIGDALAREVTLQVGGSISKRRVTVMDLSQVLVVYGEKPDGVLGLDFLQQFSRVLIDIKAKTLTLSGLQ